MAEIEDNQVGIDYLDLFRPPHYTLGSFQMARYQPSRVYHLPAPNSQEKHFFGEIRIAQNVKPKIHMMLWPEHYK